MMKRSSLLGWGCLLALLPTLALGLDPGKWTGIYKRDGKDALRVQYLVEEDEHEAAGVRVTLYAHDEPFPLQDLEVDEDGLHFTLDPGRPLECHLKRKRRGGYAGVCDPLDEDRKRGKVKLVMKPPDGLEDTPAEDSGENGEAEEDEKPEDADPEEG